MKWVNLKVVMRKSHCQETTLGGRRVLVPLKRGRDPVMAINDVRGAYVRKRTSERFDNVGFIDVPHPMSITIRQYDIEDGLALRHLLDNRIDLLELPVGQGHRGREIPDTRHVRGQVFDSSGSGSLMGTNQIGEERNRNIANHPGLRSAAALYPQNKQTPVEKTPGPSSDLSLQIADGLLTSTGQIKARVIPF
jgi:hypothetical protein